MRLRLEKCSNLERLDVGSGCIGAVTSSSSLEDLGIENCPKLVSFPFTLFPSLVKLSLWVCPQLEWPKEGSGGFPSSLKEFEIGNCPGLLACQNKWDLHACTSLTDLRIQDESFEFVDYKGGLLPPNLKKLNYKEVVPSSL
ncbi:hypothetical protein RIF29_00218 [Crotalaria pallida]|uniref:Uncharacterized protein n=1 Tax=Crotalaria pallida TaxID=3830 RepID=A0AAN9IVZ2_CROPI